MALTPTEIATLNTELNTDPEGWAYKDAGNFKADGVIADILNEPRVGKTQIKLTVPGSIILDNLDLTEWNTKTDSQKNQILALAAVPELNAANSGFPRIIIEDIFGGGSDTLANLNAARTVTIGRIQELFGWSYTRKITHLEVAEARNG